MILERIDPNLDLVLERVVDVPPNLVWKAWTEPEHLKKWFTPKPWTTVGCTIDLRPGGEFTTVMRSPEGEEHTNVGCYLEIVQDRRLVFTDALGPGFRPKSSPFMTAIISLEPHGTGTRYHAAALHNNVEIRKQHEKMGFAEGWATALDQLVEVARTF